MTELTFTSELGVTPIQHVGSDDMVIMAARVSTGLDEADLDPARRKGFINYLMKNRHGSPFEHGLFTWKIDAPIFVVREAMRHRIASYNEISGRYTKLPPTFYIYPEERPIVQSGSSAHPNITPGQPDQLALINGALHSGYERAYLSYEAALSAGAANEVARAVLPVGIYTAWYVSMNPRALMNYLSLRADQTNSAVQGKPQWEIQQISDKMELDFKEAMPLTWETWNDNGRVAP